MQRNNYNKQKNDSDSDSDADTNTITSARNEFSTSDMEREASDTDNGGLTTLPLDDESETQALHFNIPPSPPKKQRIKAGITLQIISNRGAQTPITPTFNDALSFFRQLPPEVLYIISGYLSSKDIRNLEATCREMYGQVKSSKSRKEWAKKLFTKLTANYTNHLRSGADVIPLIIFSPLVYGVGGLAATGGYLSGAARDLKNKLDPNDGIRLFTGKKIELRKPPEDNQNRKLKKENSMMRMLRR